MSVVIRPAPEAAPPRWRPAAPPTARFALRRVGQALLVVVATFVLAFLLLHALPGDAIVARYASPELGLTPEQLEALRVAYGADQPWWVQLGLSAGGFLTGDLGTSLQSGAEVSTLIAASLPPTLALAGLGFALAAVLAVGIAAAATFAGTEWLRRAFRSLPPLFVSIPVFWIGIVLLQVVSFRLGLIPVINASPAEALVLPVVTIAIPIAAPLAQVLIRAIDDTLAEPFVIVARARGAGPAWLLGREVARNALLPTLTIAGVLFGELIAGAVVTETVFARSGLGRLTADAVATRDIPVLQAVVVISAVAFVVINLAVDLLAPAIDPRLRKEVRA
ncbi:ABC transporter permease [Agrococcus sediminis]|jgi:peptide/nickel transport system permease protein|uniref:ABC transporter permease n=1 Tax=Agrococcus sediminis TaxID=2599924 RepID=A0A5M8QUW9_9MICO|nr:MULTISPECIES: ABC transporter permease [Agrococcus]KAA6437932.1 ABC transporter permease [Agrococcus sediminis]MDR7234793.1 peptide/nickel transport system permease protein [Agrococcus sp. BE272]RWR19712.1 ABC transporter permease [Agrococcus lahaulensis]